MVVLKFGGSSVATPAAITRVRAIVARERRPRVVVVSALGGVTDLLLGSSVLAASGDIAAARTVLDGLRRRHADVADALVAGCASRAALHGALTTIWSDLDGGLQQASATRACPPALRDAIAACGELASSRIVAAAFAAAGLPACWVDARQVVITDASHGQAAPLLEPSRQRAAVHLRPALASDAVPVLGGFIGATADGATTTLGRGGSDYSASFIGACLDAAEIQIWTDVDGMLTADPRVFDGGRPVQRLSYDEAATLARFGAKVLHPTTVQPAVATGIAVRILNSHNPEAPGTLIAHPTARRADTIAGLASRSGISLVTVTVAGGFPPASALRRIGELCEQTGVTVHAAALSGSGVSLAVDTGSPAERAADIARAHGAVQVQGGFALLAAVGDRLRRNSSLRLAVLRALEGVPVHAVAQSPSEEHLAVIVPESCVDQATAQLHVRVFGAYRTPDFGGVIAHGSVPAPLPSSGYEAWA